MTSPTERTYERKWHALTAVCFGTFMATMDTSIINVALPSFSAAFNASPDAVVWAALGSALVLTGLSLTAGRAGDLYGRKMIYQWGWVILIVGLAAGALAQNLEQLIAFRLIQAVGVACSVATANALVTEAFPDYERGRALGILAAVVGAGLMSGPIVGGLLLDWIDWRAIFWARIPIGILVLVLVRFLIKEQPVVSTGPRKLDIPGAALLFVGLSSTLIAVNRGQTWGWFSPVILLLGIGGIIALALFLVVEARSASPILTLSVFRIRSFSSATGSVVLNFLGQSSLVLLMPFYLIQVRGFTVAQAGLMISIVPLMMLVFATLSGWICDRTGWAHQATVGLAVVAAGLLSMATLGDNTPVPIVLLQLALVGLGSVIFGPPNTSTIMGSVPRSILGTASASVGTARNIGNSVGLAVASAVLMIVGTGAAGGSADSLSPDAMLHGIRAAFLVAGLLSVLAVIASLALPRQIPNRNDLPSDAARSRTR